MTRRSVVALAAVLVALVVAAGAIAWSVGRDEVVATVPPGPGPASSGPATLPAGVDLVASGLEVPWGIALLPDGTALVTERLSARILSVTPTGTVREVARLTGVRPAGEGGLLGIAVAPSYPDDHLVYVYYTAENDNRIARFPIAGATASPDQVAPSVTPETILSGIPKSNVHNGGRIAFGPDGMLYAGTGDASTGAPAQDRGYLGGKILRLTPDGSPAPGNPFPGSPVYSYGHRNVQGLAWDRNGQLFAAEFGQNTFDELNRIVPGGDYGWPVVEGVGQDKRFVNPVATWSTSDASPSGLAIIGDTAYLACLRGTKLYRVGTVGRDAQPLLAGQYGRLRTVAVDQQGALWILTSNRDGRGSPVAGDDRILRVNPAAL